MSRDLAGRHVLITGAASGIGRACAFAFAKRGASLTLSDIDAQGLARTALLCRALDVDVHEEVVDVSDRAAMEALAQRVHARVPALDVLINNAGVGVAGGFVDTSLELWDWAIGINLKGVVHGCHFFAPKMVERGRGHIVNVSSLAGLVGSKRMSVYCATKFAVVGFSEALQQELEAHGVGVTTICPGIIDTPITRNARLTGELASDPSYRETMVSAYQKRAYGPERVAAAIVEASLGRGGLVPVAPESWFLYYLKRLAPRLAMAIASSSQNDSNQQSAATH